MICATFGFPGNARWSVEMTSMRSCGKSPSGSWSPPGPIGPGAMPGPPGPGPMPGGICRAAIGGCPAMSGG